MTFSAFETVFYTVTFIVPGFVISAVLDAFVPPEKDRTARPWVKYLTFSCVNHGLWSWLIYWLFQSGAYAERLVLTGGLWFLITFVSPFVLGCLLGWLRTKKPVRNVLRRLGFYVVHPTPTAWEYKLGDGKAYWVVITRKDGVKIRGRYGYSSFASTDPDERDIYVERMYRQSEDKTWEPVGNSAGMWIPGRSIKHIEFIQIEGVDYD